MELPCSGAPSWRERRGARRRGAPSATTPARHFLGRASRSWTLTPPWPARWPATPWRSRPWGERYARATGRDITPPRAIAANASASARGDDAAAIDRLTFVLDEHVRIGGSRAQRDLVELTLLHALRRGGQRAKVEAMLARRPARRPLTPIEGFLPGADKTIP